MMKTKSDSCIGFKEYFLSMTSFFEENSENDEMMMEMIGEN